MFSHIANEFTCYKYGEKSDDAKISTTHAPFHTYARRHFARIVPFILQQNQLSSSKIRSPPRSSMSFSKQLEQNEASQPCIPSVCNKQFHNT